MSSDENIAPISSGLKSFVGTAEALLKASPLFGVFSAFGVTIPYAITFYLLWKRFLKKRALADVKIDTIVMDQIKLRRKIVELEKKKQELTGSMEILRLEKTTGNLKFDTETQMNIARSNLDSIETEMESLLLQYEFFSHVRFLLDQKKTFQSNGLWDRVDRLSKVEVPQLNQDLIEKNVSKVTDLRQFVESMNEKERFYKYMTME